jgi:hypothetical protein
MSKSYQNLTIWEGLPLKLAILVPTRDMVHTHFSYSIAQLLSTTREMGIDAYLFYDSSTILLNQRERLIEKAKEINADYVLWLDSDMMFPSTTALRLIHHGKDIVGCNYRKRSKPLTTVAFTDLTDWSSWLPLEPQNELVKVEGVGMGCLLMKTDVFYGLEKPYFEFTFKEDTQDWFGEDFNLQKKLRNNNCEIFIDTVLSNEIKHIGLFAYGNQNINYEQN